MATRSLWLAAAAALASCAVLAACGGPSGGGSTVPSLGTSVAGGDAGQSRASELDAAASCIRQHGIPAYHDPVLTPDGQVYTDSRSFDDATGAVMSAALSACRTLIVRADFHPDGEPPAPPQLVQAGVRSAECERLHGMPNVTDPTSRSMYTPGHGFGISAAEAPPGGKASPGFQESLRACHQQIAAELRASTLGSLGSDG